MQFVKLSPSRLEEIAGLVEGWILALNKFVRQWCGKVDVKSAKHRQLDYSNFILDQFLYIPNLA
jgi:hypothetical protein